MRRKRRDADLIPHSGISLAERDLKQCLQPHNPHINNFQVPLLFHHPHLPALALDAKVIPSVGASEPLPALSFAMPTPGRGHVIVSSPDPAVPWRLSMPVCHHGTLAATNLDEDPQEDHPVRTVSLARLIREAERRWGHEAGQWFEQAEKRAVVWVREVSRRWGVNQRSPPGEMVIKYSV